MKFWRRTNINLDGCEVYINTLTRELAREEDGSNLVQLTADQNRIALTIMDARTRGCEPAASLGWRFRQ